MFEAFYRTLTVGDERGVSAVTASSIHSPVVHYFALFVAKCLLAREKVGALSAPDFAVLRRALEGDNTYSLGAIVARGCPLLSTPTTTQASDRLPS